MTTTTIVCNGRKATVDVALRPDPDCPLAVVIDIAHRDGESVSWWVSRELLSAGRIARVGEADVIVHPGCTGREVLVHLSGQDDDGNETAAALTLPLSQVTAVLAASRPAIRDAAGRLDALVDDVIERCLS